MTLPASAERVQIELDRLGVPAKVVLLDQTTRSAADAAAAVGCDLSQIAKSLVFRSAKSSKPILVITSGAHRVDEAGLGKRIGEPIERADPDFVRETTGYAIGGVPPVALATPIQTYFDEDLLPHPTIWAAAGTPRALFEVDPRLLLRVCGGVAVRVG